MEDEDSNTCSVVKVPVCVCVSIDDEGGRLDNTIGGKGARLGLMFGSEGGRLPVRSDMREIYKVKSYSIHIRREALSITHLSGESMTSHSLGQSKLYYVLVLVEQCRYSLLRGASLMLYSGRLQ